MLGNCSALRQRHAKGTDLSYVDSALQTQGESVCPHSFLLPCAMLAALATFSSPATSLPSSVQAWARPPDRYHAQPLDRPADRESAHSRPSPTRHTKGTRSRAASWLSAVAGLVAAPTAWSATSPSRLRSCRSRGSAVQSGRLPINAHRERSLHRTEPSAHGPHDERTNSESSLPEAKSADIGPMLRAR